jgi:formylmethanofuran dehydrogenase subunit B
MDGNRKNTRRARSCGCVCDDIELHAENNKIVKAKNACSLGEAHFKYHTAEHHYPDALIDGKPATVAEAVWVAGRHPHNANMPLVRAQQRHARPRAAPWPWPK